MSRATIPFPMRPAARATPFRRAYVEREAFRYPETNEILANIPGIPVIPVDDYRDVFHRPGQSFRTQKSSPAIILAVKHGELLYRGNERIDSWNHGSVYYNDLVRNCVYNCEYCFLQGMHHSAHALVFVNFNDFLGAVRAEATTAGNSLSSQLHLSVSYLTDLLGFEPIVPYASRWIATAREIPEVEIELRTKSDNYPLLRAIKAVPNVVLTWSLSPGPVAARFERGTAGFRNRLFSAAEAVRAGWRLRLCLDPVLAVPEWEELYEACISEIFGRIRSEQVELLSIGALRMNTAQLSRIRRERPESALLARTLRGSGKPRGPQGGLATYAPELLDEIRLKVVSMAARRMPRERIVFVHG